MNFYIGDSCDEIKICDENVVIDDNLFVYLCKICETGPYDLGALCRIDPYADVVIPKTEVMKLIEVGQCILEKSLLLNYISRYEGRKEGELRIYKMIQIAEKAIRKGKGLVSVGD